MRQIHFNSPIVGSGLISKSRMSWENKRSNYSLKPRDTEPKLNVDVTVFNWDSHFWKTLFCHCTNEFFSPVISFYWCHPHCWALIRQFIHYTCVHFQLRVISLAGRLYKEHVLQGSVGCWHGRGNMLLWGWGGVFLCVCGLFVFLLLLFFWAFCVVWCFFCRSHEFLKSFLCLVWPHMLVVSHVATLVLLIVIIG